MIAPPTIGQSVTAAAADYRRDTFNPATLAKLIEELEHSLRRQIKTKRNGSSCGRRFDLAGRNAMFMALSRAGIDRCPRSSVPESMADVQIFNCEQF